jgi:tripartite-type tricarboxylate transporter receptor subunit TctC
MAGIEMVHVPYRGNAPAITDLLGGRISMVSSSIGSFRPGLETKKITLLLTATKNRLPYAPDLPTSAEAGLPGYLMSVWIGVVAPAGTPAPMLARIHALTEAMQNDAASQKAMASAGLDVVTMSQPEFAAFVKSEYTRWGQIVKDAGVEKQ